MKSAAANYGSGRREANDLFFTFKQIKWYFFHSGVKNSTQTLSEQQLNQQEILER